MSSQRFLLNFAALLCLSLDSANLSLATQKLSCSTTATKELNLALGELSPRIKIANAVADFLEEAAKSKTQVHFVVDGKASQGLAEQVETLIQKLPAHAVIDVFQSKIFIYKASDSRSVNATRQIAWKHSLDGGGQVHIYRSRSGSFNDLAAGLVNSDVQAVTIRKKIKSI